MAASHGRPGGSLWRHCHQGGGQPHVRGGVSRGLAATGMYVGRDGRTELWVPGYGPVHGTGVCWRQPREWGRKASPMDAVDLTNTPDEGDLLRTPAVDATLPP